MDIKNGFSNLAKNITYGATQVAKKSGELVEISKLNLNINSNEDKIYELYAEMGEVVFQKYRKTGDIEYDLKTICRNINEILEDNEQLSLKIKKLNNIKRCSNCGEDMKLEVTYCPKCGLRQVN